MPDAAAPQSEPIHLRLQQVAARLEARFLGRDEAIRALLVSVIAGEHLALIGPPGTAKSALVRAFSKATSARFFEYLLTRFTEPSELFGPVDIAAFRTGDYRRRTEGMLPEAELVFLDEIFKSSSAILNALLTLLNERTFIAGGRATKAPILSVVGASNEVPTDGDLAAIFDRFLLRVRTTQLDAIHFRALLSRGWRAEMMADEPVEEGPLVTADELRQARRALGTQTSIDEAFIATYRGLVLQLRAEGVALSDRRVVKLLRLCAASALLDGRTQLDDGDLWVLRHVWGTEDQISIVEGIVEPVLEAHLREHPEARRIGAARVGLPAIAAEIERVRAALSAGPVLTDVQLFAQLKVLGELKTALAPMREAEARALGEQIDALLEAAMRGGRLGAL
ncbi:MAG: AAA family ATPase [Polyangiales bacterium]